MKMFCMQRPRAAYALGSDKLFDETCQYNLIYWCFDKKFWVLASWTDVCQLYPSYVDKTQLRNRENGASGVEAGDRQTSDIWKITTRLCKY